MKTNYEIINARARKPEAARDVFLKAPAANPNSDTIVERLAGVETQLGNAARAFQLIDGHTFQPTHQTYALLHLHRAMRRGCATTRSTCAPTPSAWRDSTRRSEETGRRLPGTSGAASSPISPTPTGTRPGPGCSPGCWTAFGRRRR